MQGGTLKKHPRLRKYYFYRSRGYTVSQIMDHRANSNQPQIVKIRKALVTSIELSLFDPVHFRIEHLNRKKVEKVSISKAVVKKRYPLSMKNLISLQYVSTVDYSRSAFLIKFCFQKPKSFVEA